MPASPAARASNQQVIAGQRDCRAEMRVDLRRAAYVGKMHVIAKLPTVATSTVNVNRAGIEVDHPIRGMNVAGNAAHKPVRRHVNRGTETRLSWVVLEYDRTPWNPNRRRVKPARWRRPARSQSIRSGGQLNRYSCMSPSDLRCGFSEALHRNTYCLSSKPSWKIESSNM